MKVIVIVAALLAACCLACTVCAQTKTKNKTAVCTGEDACCKPGTKTAKTTTALTCKLTTPEMRERKETVIKSLKSQILQKKELPNGFAYKFAGSDKIIDELTEFIKTERSCCDFFTFSLLVGGDKKEACLQITGPKGAKEFIKTELEM